MENCPDCEQDSVEYIGSGSFHCMDCQSIFEDYEPLPYRGED